MIGTIAGLDFEGTKQEQQEQRATLFRSGILAFERVGLRKSVDDLKELSSLTAVELLNVLASQDFYESGLWVDILRSRVQAISGFRDLSTADEKEKVLQDHLFSHLWMLDPAWERATLSPTMEEDLRKISPGDYAVDDEGAELKGRVDIRYATNSGKHVIVELKRYSRSVDIDELYAQGTKYAVALNQLLVRQSEDAPNIEVVFVLGQQPTAKNRGLSSDKVYITGRLTPINGRYVLYDQLIANARNQYNDYLQASDRAKELDELLGVLGQIDVDEPATVTV
jgi:hypothetical protein